MATGHSATTASSFETWAESIRWENGLLPISLRVELAGVALMAGDDTFAKTTAAQADGIAPENLTRLGWWYFRARRFDSSRALLNQVAPTRPGDADTSASLAWNDLQDHKPADAARRLAMLERSSTWNSPIMCRAIACRAIARWQIRQIDGAIMDFESSIASEPEWNDPRWVTAQFPDWVEANVAGMDSERRKRIAARLAEKRKRDGGK